MIKRNINWKRVYTVKRSYNSNIFTGIVYRTGTNETNKKEKVYFRTKVINRNNYEQPMKNN